MRKVLMFTMAGFTVLFLVGIIPSSRSSGQSAEAMRGGAGRNKAGPAESLLRLFDTDSDGALTGDEFEKAGAKLKEIDASKDGKLTVRELRTRLSSRANPPPRRRGEYGFDFGGTSKHDKPPLAKNDREKRILSST